MATALVGALACALVGAVAGPGRAQQPAELPDALPPLDDAVIGEAPPLRLFAGARLRGTLEDARDLTRGDGMLAGIGLAGRVGVEAQLDFGHLAIAFAEAGLLGAPGQSPALVARPPLAPLQQAELVIETRLFGLPAELALGRAPVVIADGRMLGDEPFDLRGRTLDGARARVRSGGVDAGLGAWWLGGFADELDVVAAADSTLHVGDDVDLAAWALAERAGASALIVPTLGTRVAGRVGMLEGRAAADMQAPLAAGSLERAGLAARLTAGGRATLESSAFDVTLPTTFLDLDADLVAGDVVLGRVLRAPAPSTHGTRGALDLLAPDNTWRTALAVGLVEERLQGSLTGLLVGVVDRAGPLLDPLGAALPSRRRGGAGLALLELDVQLQARLSDDLTLGVLYGIAAPGPALIGEVPAQRLLVELGARTGDR